MYSVVTSASQPNLLLFVDANRVHVLLTQLAREQALLNSLTSPYSRRNFDTTRQLRRSEAERTPAFILLTVVRATRADTDEKLLASW